MRRRIAVVGDTLTSGGQILDYEQKTGFRFHGHKTALIGGLAYCASCKSTGAITKAGGPYRIRYHTAHEAALDRDIVLCKCPTPPAIIATLAGESWVEDRDREYTAAANPLAARANSSNNTSDQYDEQFTLRDGNGRALPGTYYTVRLPSGALRHGITDSHGCTTRYETDGTCSVRIILATNRRPDA